MENMALAMCDTPAALNFKAMMCGWDKGYPIIMRASK